MVPADPERIEARLVRALDLRDQALRRSEALTARRSSVNAAAKLSMPISTLT